MKKLSNENAVVMACDKNYAPYALFLASQIALSHPDRNFDICIFSQDVLELPPGLAELGINLEIIPGQNPFSNGPNPSRHGAAAYLRLLIPPLAIHRYKRLLYLDSDIFWMGWALNAYFRLTCWMQPLLPYGTISNGARLIALYPNSKSLA